MLKSINLNMAVCLQYTANKTYIFLKYCFIINGKVKFQPALFKLSFGKLTTEVNEESVSNEEDEIEKLRNVSRMPPYYRERMNHCYKAPPILFAHQKEKKYERKMYAKLGASSGIDPTVMWPSPEELKEIIEDEKELCPSFQEMMANITKRKQEEEEVIRAREKDVEERMSKMKGWLEEYYAKERLKEKVIEQQKAKKKSLMEEAQRIIGYAVDPKDARFKQLMAEKEEEERKRLKAEKKKLKEAKMMARLTEAITGKTQTPSS